MECCGMHRFALIGLAGYIAPRHVKAIKDTGNTLIAALDPNQSVGVIDSYFPDANFFTEFERFDRHIDKLRRRGQGVAYISICSPNYLHDAHIRFTLRSHANAICEKPLVLNPWNIDALEEFERESGHGIFSILQLRLHPTIIALRERILAAPSHQRFDVDLTYLTARGNWYHATWKGRQEQSGGIATNIGVHFFDMLGWVFGACRDNQVHFQQPDAASGYLEFERARVRWFLSINASHLPPAVRERGQRTFRSIRIDGEELEFSDGFTDLHTLSYAEILAGNGFRLSDVRPSIDLVYSIRNGAVIKAGDNAHPLTRLLTE